MKKQRWYAITYEQRNPLVKEEVIGFSQALLFRTREKAEEHFKQSGYKKTWEKLLGGGKARRAIKRVYI